jgi:hypothetical protein
LDAWHRCHCAFADSQSNRAPGQERRIRLHRPRSRRRPRLYSGPLNASPRPPLVSLRFRAFSSTTTAERRGTEKGGGACLRVCDCPHVFAMRVVRLSELAIPLATASARLGHLALRTLACRDAGSLLPLRAGQLQACASLIAPSGATTRRLSA